jgi:cold-inducible RNA-binding protein
MNIYVGNLSYDATDEDLRKTFEAHGEVAKATVIMDRDTGRAKGFGFVEMPNSQEAQNAIQQLNGVSLMGRNITVNEARPKEPKPSRGGSSRGGGRW